LGGCAAGGLDGGAAAGGLDGAGWLAALCLCGFLACLCGLCGLVAGLVDCAAGWVAVPAGELEGAACGCRVGADDGLAVEQPATRMPAKATAASNRASVGDMQRFLPVDEIQGPAPPPYGPGRDPRSHGPRPGVQPDYRCGLGGLRPRK